jgi:hypothetical protein
MVAKDLPCLRDLVEVLGENVLGCVAISGIFCLFDRRPAEPELTVAPGLLSFVVFLFRVAGVEDVLGGSAGTEGVAGDEAAWLAAWRAEDLVILADISGSKEKMWNLKPRMRYA